MTRDVPCWPNPGSGLTGCAGGDATVFEALHGDCLPRVLQYADEKARLEGVIGGSQRVWIDELARRLFA